MPLGFPIRVGPHQHHHRIGSLGRRHGIAQKIALQGRTQAHLRPLKDDRTLGGVLDLDIHRLPRLEFEACLDLPAPQGEERFARGRRVREAIDHDLTAHPQTRPAGLDQRKDMATTFAGRQLAPRSEGKSAGLQAFARRTEIEKLSAVGDLALDRLALPLETRIEFHRKGALTPRPHEVRRLQ